jgi:nucleoside-diphosphate-sugar epimerase
MNRESKPTILLTGATANLGSSMAADLQRDYVVIGLDRPGKDAEQKASIPLIARWTWARRSHASQRARARKRTINGS